MNWDPCGINVTVVHPGTTRTERTAPRITELAQKEGLAEAVIEKRMADGNSIKHLVDASEVAYIVAFLASPEASYISGVIMPVDGGSVAAGAYMVEKYRRRKKAN